MADVTTTLALHLLRRTARPDEGTLRLTGEAVPARGAQVSGTGTPDVTVRVHDCRAFSAVPRRGSAGLATSYRDGWRDADDLTGLVWVLSRRTAGIGRVLEGAAHQAGTPVAAVKRLRPPTRAAHGEEVAAVDLDRRFRRMWDLYLSYCEAAFEERLISDVQLVKSRPGSAVAGLGVGAPR